MKDNVRNIISLGVLVFSLTVLSVPGFASPQFELQKLLAGDGASGDFFGWSVAIDSDTVVVGSPRDNDAGNLSGSIYVFVRGPSDAWIQQAKLTANDGGPADLFGRSVGISGNTIVVGALSDDAGIFSGSAYVFIRDASGGWTQQAKLLASDGESRDLFGDSVAISGDTVVIGAPDDDGIGPDSGSAYVFVRDIGGNWTQQAKLITNDSAAGDRFGSSVTTVGQTAVIGAYLDDGAIGSAYVFTRDSSNNWNQQAKLTANDGAAGDLFGLAVGLSGDIAIIGSPFDDDAGSQSGSAYVFTRDIGGNWSQEAKLIAGDINSGDGFGWSVAIGNDAVLVGARAADFFGFQSGSAYIFTRSSSGAWTEQSHLVASDGTLFDLLGWSVALSGDTAVVGAIGNDDGGTQAGSAYIYAVITDDEGPVIRNVTAIPNPIAVNTALTLTADVDDTGTGGSTIDSATFSVTKQGVLITSGYMTAADGTFDEASESVVASLGGIAEAAVLEACVSGTDSAGNTGASACTFVPVYDPQDGFVTGGGWIDSPSGAYVANPEVTGKANFGFVSKYKKGQQTPSGNTQFQFKAGNFSFHSDTYEWLVVAGHRAQFKGTGRVNNAGNYGFMLTAIDADLTPSTNTDLFRIKVWDKDNADTVVYDNELGADLDANPTSAVGGGSIVIHNN